MDQNENTQGMEAQTAPEAAAQTGPDTAAGEPVSANAAEGQTDSVSEDWGEDAIFPEGWKPGDSALLSVPDGDRLSDFGIIPAPESGSQPTEAAEALTTDTGSEGTPSAPKKTPDGDRLPDGQTGTETPAEPDYKALWEQETARREDEAERRNAEKYRAIVRNLMENEGTAEALAKLAAANECGGKNYPLTDDSPESSPGLPSVRQPVDFGAAVHSIHSKFPDARDMPAEVTESILRGDDPVGAYAAHRTRSLEQENKSIREENARLKSQLDAVRRAPVRGVTGNSPQQKPKSAFEWGFDAAFE